MRDAAASRAIPWRRQIEMHPVHQSTLPLKPWRRTETRITAEIRAGVARLTLSGLHRALQLEINGQPVRLPKRSLPLQKEVDLEISEAIRYGKNQLTIRATGFPLWGALQIRMEEPVLDLRVLHLNDSHGHLPPMPHLAAAVRRLRAEKPESTYLFHAGDIFSGGPVSDLNQGAPTIQVLNAMGVDLLAVGNHDFDHGPEQTKLRREESRFPWLAANASVADPAATPIPDFPGVHILTNSLGQRIGVFGLIQTPPATVAGNIAGLSFADPVGTAAALVDRLRPEVNLLVALTHIGLQEDLRLARAVEGIDLIIGGHTHTALRAPVYAGSTAILQAGSAGQFLGQLDLRAAGHTVQIESRLIPLEEMANREPAVQQLVDTWNDRMTPILDEQIGTSLHELTMANRTRMDVGIGNLLTDAMRATMDSQIALLNNTGMRAPLPAGPITLRDLSRVLPFGNYFVTISLTGRQIRDVILASYNRRNQVDLQTAGLSYTILTGADGRARDAHLLLDGAPLEPEASYTVTIPNYLYTAETYPIVTYDRPKLAFSGRSDLLDTADHIRQQGALDYPATAGRILIRRSE